jgi:hypothetical protein
MGTRAAKPRRTRNRTQVGWTAPREGPVMPRVDPATVLPDVRVRFYQNCGDRRDHPFLSRASDVSAAANTHPR